jgi:hypothetical protein
MISFDDSEMAMLVQSRFIWVEVNTNWSQAFLAPLPKWAQSLKTVVNDRSANPTSPVQSHEMLDTEERG